MNIKYVLAVLFVICIISLSFAIGNTSSHKVKDHSRLLYKAGGETNIWFFSFLRCKIKLDEKFTYRKHRMIPKNGRVFYEHGGVLEINGDRISYLGATNSLGDATCYVITSTTNQPNRFIRCFD